MLRQSAKYSYITLSLIYTNLPFVNIRKVQKNVHYWQFTDRVSNRK